MTARAKKAPVEPTLCQIRLKAARIIQRRGWRRGAFIGSKQGSCSVCVMGAIALACGATVAELRADQWGAFSALVQMQLNRVVRAMDFDDGTSWNGGKAEAVRWNDAPGRKKAEVLHRLRDGCQP